MVLGLSVFSENSGRSCYKLRISSVFYLWFSFAKPPKYSSFWERQTLLSAFLEMHKPVIRTANKNLERIIFNLVHIGIDPLPFLIENLSHVKVVCCLSRVLKKRQGCCCELSSVALMLSLIGLADALEQELEHRFLRFLAVVWTVQRMHCQLS